MLWQCNELIKIKILIINDDRNKNKEKTCQHLNYDYFKSKNNHECCYIEEKAVSIEAIQKTKQKLFWTWKTSTGNNYYANYVTPLIDQCHIT